MDIRKRWLTRTQPFRTRGQGCPRSVAVWKFIASRLRMLPSSPGILGRIANPVEPLDFELAPREPLSPSLHGIGKGVRQQPGLFEEVNDRQTEKLEFIHN